MHPAEAIKGNHSHSLANKTIVLGVCSSIAAVKTIELARELIRNDATVYPVISKETETIIQPTSLEYATGQPVLSALSGKVEHVSWLGEKGTADCLLIAPCTANMIGKIANGIADCPLSTLALTALATKPILIVPSMHTPMWNNVLVQVNLQKLRSLGVHIIPPIGEEGAMKFPHKQHIVLHVERAVSNNSLHGKNMLIVSGKSQENIDPIRVITNRASGKTGNELAQEAFRRGANVHVIHNTPLNIPGISEETAFFLSEFYDKTLSRLEKGFDWVILPAALGDFSVEGANTKLDSQHEQTITLHPAQKLLERIKKRFPEQKVCAFKATVNRSKEGLLDIGKEKRVQDGVNIVVANDITEKGMGTDDTAVWIVGPYTQDWVEGNKRFIARAILTKISDN
jgi:phosphopantothenoylcysteine decarboxylase / phosphopantothenate---cysteine ligase